MAPSTDKGVSQSCSPPAVLLDLITSMQNLSQCDLIISRAPEASSHTEGRLTAAFSRRALFCQCKKINQIQLVCHPYFANLEMTSRPCYRGPLNFRCIFAWPANEMRDLDACSLKSAWSGQPAFL